MVRKLIKYDFKAFAKIMLPVYFALIGVAAVYRIMSIFENDSTFYAFLNGSGIAIIVISIGVAFVLTFIFSVVRFYKNLFTTEGYLSFTLPVTPAAHIFSKLIVALIFDALTFVASIAAVSVAMFGETFVEVAKAAGYLLKGFYKAIGPQGPLFTAGFILLALISTATAHLLVYMCISIGQMANRRKMLLAIGIYFGIYVIKQTVYTVLMAFGTITGLFESIVMFFSESPKTAFHLFFCGAILIYSLFAMLYFFISHRLIKKRLNLE